MTKARMRNISAKTLTGRPHLPSENWHDNNGLPETLLQAMDPIEIMYEASSAAVVRAVS